MNIEIVITILLSILLLVSTFISTKAKLIDRRKKGFNAITKNGRLLIIINLLILSALIGQYFINKHNIEQRELENRIYLETQDSIMRAEYNLSIVKMKSEFDKNNLKITSTVAEILGKYGYRLDSTNQTLVKILKDSSKTKVIMPDNPVLLCSNFEYYEKIDEFDYYKIYFTSYDASSTGFNITCEFVGKDSINRLHLLGTGKFLTRYDKLFKNSTQYFYYKIPSNDLKYSMIYFSVYGNYYNTDKSKSFTINGLHYYNIKNKSFGKINISRGVEFLDFLNSIELNN